MGILQGISDSLHGTRRIFKRLSKSALRKGSVDSRRGSDNSAFHGNGLAYKERFKDGTLSSPQPLPSETQKQAETRRIDLEQEYIASTTDRLCGVCSESCSLDNTNTSVNIPIPIPDSREPTPSALLSNTAAPYISVETAFAEDNDEASISTSSKGAISSSTAKQDMGSYYSHEARPEELESSRSNLSIPEPEVDSPTTITSAKLRFKNSMTNIAANPKVSASTSAPIEKLAYRSTNILKDKTRWRDLQIRRHKMLNMRSDAYRIRYKLQSKQRQINDLDAKIIQEEVLAARDCNSTVPRELQELLRQAIVLRSEQADLFEEVSRIEDQLHIKESKFGKIEQKMYKRVEVVIGEPSESDVERSEQEMEDSDSSELEEYEEDEFESRIGDYKIAEEQYDMLVEEYERVIERQEWLAGMGKELGEEDREFLDEYDEEKAELLLTMQQIRGDLERLHPSYLYLTPDERDPKKQEVITYESDKETMDGHNLEKYDALPFLHPVLKDSDWNMLISSLAEDDPLHRIDGWLLHQIQISRWEVSNMLWQENLSENQLHADEQQLDFLRRWFDAPPPDSYKLRTLSVEISDSTLSVSRSVALMDAQQPDHQEAGDFG